MNLKLRIAVLVGVEALGLGCGSAEEKRAGVGGVGLQKVQHIIVIMQENRSFDHYFGTFPGAEGIPMDEHGIPTVCVNDPKTGTCVKPYRLTADENIGGPHNAQHAAADIAGGTMDGFIAQAEAAKSGCADPNDPGCINGTLIDVMGYHTDAEIPNYWAYARNFVLQDHMFQPNASWSLPQHLFMVSGWSAQCTADDPMACTSELSASFGFKPRLREERVYPWTDLTYLLHKTAVT